jgi:hypothetical protein
MCPRSVALLHNATLAVIPLPFRLFGARGIGESVGAMVCVSGGARAVSIDHDKSERPPRPRRGPPRRCGLETMVLHFLSPAGDRIRAATPYLDPRVLGSFAPPWVSPPAIRRRQIRRTLAASIELHT